jgi:hypothetical protein
MKFMLLTILGSVILSVGCKKEAEAIPSPIDETHNVSFSISNYSEKLNATTLTPDSVKNFVYHIYNSKGERVRNFNGDVSKSALSVELKGTLEPGKYKFVFFTSEKPLDLHLADAADEISSFVYANTFNIYHKSVEVTIASKPEKRDVQLDRLNSSLEISLLDEVIPENVASIQVVWNDNKYVDFDGNSFTSARKQKSIPVQSSTGKLEKLSTYVFNTSSPFSIYINYLDKNGKYVLGREINNVRCYKNQKTSISGYLFNTSSAPLQNSMNISL